MNRTGPRGPSSGPPASGSPLLPRHGFGTPGGLWAILLSLFLWGLPVTQAAQNPSGGLRIRIRTAPNFVVDSNVETPATYAPRSAYIGARVCNESQTTFEDVHLTVGDYDPNGDQNGSDSTPGVYPVTSVSAGMGRGYSGDFALRHLGGRLGTADAKRHIDTLAPGECSSQWWLVSYPRMDSEPVSDTDWNDGEVGNAVWGAANDPTDDLVLGYDVWATGTPVGGTAVTAWETRTATLRNEISAKANKIWPNTTSKVPTEFLDLTTLPLGWNILESGGVSGVLPGDTFTMGGIWYDFGVVGQGFDNDGDLVPDYNAWMQPVGDPAYFDPGCFRPVTMQGVLIVKHTDGTEQIIPFKDDLYFEHLPEDNNGVVGVVFYTFLVLDSPCSSSLSPYQEVASGSENEKFNGDFGALSGQPLPNPVPPTAGLGKTVSPTTIFPLPGVATWTMAFTNTSAAALGNPSFNYPVIVRDAIPSGTTYRSGTASATVSGGAHVWYSVDGGGTWVAVEPVPASAVTHLEWRLDSALPVGGVGNVTFQTDIPSGYVGAVIPNTATLRVGDALPLATATATAVVGGTRQVGDTVFRDDGVGTAGNGVQNAGEPGLSGVLVRLYFDANADGVLDAGDLLMGSQTTDGNGGYLFSNLPASRWIVVVDSTSAGVPVGYGLSTAEAIAANTIPGNVLTADFGFAPALGISKEVLGSGSAYEGNEVRFKIDLWNQLRAADGSSLGAVPGCTYNAYPTVLTSANFTSPSSALGAPELTFADGTYATTTFVPGKERLEVEQFTISGGAPTSHLILNVDAVAYLRRKAADVFSNDAMNLFILRGGNTLDSLTFSPAQLNAISDTGFSTVLWNLTDSATWDWSSLSLTTGNHLAVLANKSGAADGAMYLDALGLRITTDCGGDIAGSYHPSRSLYPVRLVDTYDPSRMEFVSASRPPTSVNAVTGEIIWSDLGPINPAGSLSIVLVFRLRSVDGNATLSTSNTATVAEASFADGRPANTPNDAASVSILPTGSISGYIWSDTVGPANGWQGTTGYQSGEPKAAGVSVELLQCTVVNNTGGCDAFVVVASTRTDETGHYQFTGLIPGGRYTSRVVTTSFVGNPSPVQTGDPDDDTTRGSTGNGGTCGGGGGDVPCDSTWGDGLTLVLGTATYGTTDAYNYTNINFGYTLSAALFGYVWRDVDGDGLRDSGEPGISGVSLCLDTNNDGSCAGEATTTTTDANGRYVFSALAAGSYRVAVNTSSPALAGATQTGDPDESGVCATCDHKTTTAVTLVTGDLRGPKDFGFRVPGTSSIGDLVYLDNDGDGQQDLNDPGIAGVTLRLHFDANGNSSYDPAVDLLVGQVVTDANGGYLFSSLASGTYFVVLDETTLPGSYAQTDDPDSSGTCSGSACDARSAAVVLTGSSARNDVDFGYQPPSNGYLGDRVFHDRNGNGVVDGDFEVGIDGITVWLCPGSASSCDVSHAVATAVTAGGGWYSFTGLNDGPYKVAFDTADLQIPTDFAGDRFVPTTSVVHSVLIVNGLVSTLDGSGCAGCNLDVDFGLVGRGAIGDYLFYDTNRNGTQDPAEPGIPGVRVFLCLASVSTCDALSAVDAVLTSDGTDGNPPGAYLFHGLAPGSYQVAVDASTLPSGLSASSLTSDPDTDGIPCSALSPTSDPPASACDGVTGSGSYRDISLSYGGVYTAADFGYAPPGVIGDRVWLDLDQDGVQDPGELGVANVRVWLDASNPGVLDWVDADADGVWDSGEGERWVRTDLDGYYSFENVADGTHVVAMEIPAARAVSFDGDGTRDGRVVVQMSAGGLTSIGGSACTGCDLSVDFGLKLNGAYTYSGNVCLDDPGLDGACTGTVGEQNLAGIVVYLYDASNRSVGSTGTLSDGSYRFTGLTEGSYRAVIGTTATPLDIANATTSGAGVTVNSSSIVRLATIAGASVEDVDFAFELNVALDFGDLPNTYATALASDGARHEIPSGGSTLWLGATPPDAEWDAVPPLDGTGDGADEDGVLTVLPAQWKDGTGAGALTVQASGASGWLVGWIDYNRDGDFLDSGELVASRSVAAGEAVALSLNIPAGTFTSPVVSLPSRFRMLTESPAVAAVAYLGQVLDGEVEDHIFVVGRSNTITGMVAMDGGDPGFGGDTGILGVRVDLYSDPDGDGVVDPADLIATTSTQADGSYAFTGVGNGTYLVVETDPTGAVDVTDRDGDLGGNGFDKIRVILAGADSNANDFLETGLALGSIAGAVYDDDGTGVVGDGLFGGDAPVAGVTVTLYLDLNQDGVAQSGEWVATTLTDESGAYLFSNLPAGRYLVVETDPAGLVSVTDRGEPDGTNDDNTILLQIDGDHLTGQDFLDDGPPPPDRDYGDLPDLGVGTGTGDYATLAADSGPSHQVYAGGGFRLGNAIDAESDGQPSQTIIGGDDGTGADDEDGLTFPALPTVGTTIQVTVNLGAVPEGLTPWFSLWFDFNGDGDFEDAGEQVVSDLGTLALGDNLVSVTLPEDALTGTEIGVRARLADSTGVGSTGAAGYGEVEDYLLSLEPLPTAALITGVVVSGAGTEFLVSWQTGYEAGSVAFRAMARLPGEASWSPVSAEWVAASRRPLGARYQVQGPLRHTAGLAEIGVLELQADGSERLHGPFEVGVWDMVPASEDPTRSGTAPLQAAASLMTGGGEGSPVKRVGSQHAVTTGTSTTATAAGPRPAFGVRPAAYARFETQQRGLHHVAVGELALATGRRPDLLATLLRSGALGLSEGGRSVGYVPDEAGTGFYFQAEAPEGLDSRTRVYWLAGGQNPVPEPLDGAPVVTSGVPKHRGQYHAEQDLEMVATLTSDPTEDYWVWNALVPGNAAFQRRTYAFRLSDLDQADSNGFVFLEVELVGGDEGSRRVVAELPATRGDVAIGEVTWGGRGRVRLQARFEARYLLNGVNRLQLRALPVPGARPGGLVYMDSYRLDYPGVLSTAGGLQEFQVDRDQVVELPGFLSSSITVLDVTEAVAPRPVLRAAVVEGGGRFGVRFAAKAERRYAVLEPGHAHPVLRLRGVGEPLLARTTNQADYLVVAPSSLIAASGELARWRETQGLRSRVVALEDIADEFGGGLPTPRSLVSFLAAARTQWEVRPRYLVLVGNGTPDYRDLLQAHDNLLPAAMVGTRHGLVPSDAGLATEGLSVGRLPVVDAGELAAVIAKIRDHETRPQSAPLEALVCADADDGGGPFSLHAHDIAAVLDRSYRTRLAARNDGMDQELLRTQLLDALRTDLSLLVYSGHGAPDRLGASGYLTSSDVPRLAGAGRQLPVMVALTCLAGDFAIPGVDALSERLLLEPGRGVVAALAPTGLSEDRQAHALGMQFLSGLASRAPGARIGDLLRQAVAAFRAAGGAEETLTLFNLIGDPALRMSPAQDARVSTPSVVGVAP